ncbi:MAG: hypothetical protein HY686_06185 [Chloroflexi bacterium]|nr:hypothetical protein [Chloroflexota bacterium]
MRTLCRFLPVLEHLLPMYPRSDSSAQAPDGSGVRGQGRFPWAMTIRLRQPMSTGPGRLITEP